MSEWEKALKVEKQRVDEAEVPDELEGRLRNALAQRPSKKPRKHRIGWMIAAVLLAFLLVGYNHNSLAFYGKKIFGFDQVVSGSLKQLNDLGQGQTLNKSRTFPDGTKLTLNGVMSDANQMILFYTLSNPNAKFGELGQSFTPWHITGFLTNSHADGGKGKLNKAHTKIKWIRTFEPPSPFAKHLTLHYTFKNQPGTISFPYDPNKAMGYTIKQNVNKSVKTGPTTFFLNAIQASPTETVIKGSVKVKKLTDFDTRIIIPIKSLQLLANGKPLEAKGGGGNLGSWEWEFEALPKNLKSLKVKLVRSYAYKKINKTINLGTLHKGDQLNIGGQRLTIQGISVTDQATKINIVSKNGVSLENTYVKNKNGRFSLKSANTEKLIKKRTGKKTGNILRKRTLVFETDGFAENLLIGDVRFIKAYNKTIDIPID